MRTDLLISIAISALWLVSPSHVVKAQQGPPPPLGTGDAPPDDSVTPSLASPPPSPAVPTSTGPPSTSAAGDASSAAASPSSYTSLSNGLPPPPPATQRYTLDLPAGACTAPFTYQTQSGDTICSLVTTFNVSDTLLSAANPGETFPASPQTGVAIGLQMEIPCPPVRGCCPSYAYAVRAADTAQNISDSAAIPLSELQAANPSTSLSSLACGDSIMIPCKAGAAPCPAPPPPPSSLVLGLPPSKAPQPSPASPDSPSLPLVNPGAPIPSRAITLPVSSSPSPNSGAHALVNPYGVQTPSPAQAFTPPASIAQIPTAQAVQSPASTSSGSCKIEANANYQGNVLMNVTSRSAQDCCSQCQQTQGCNVFVFCGGLGGCDNGYGILVPSKLCTLKAQAGLLSTQQPTAWDRGPNVPFTSGALALVNPSGVQTTSPAQLPLPSAPVAQTPTVQAAQSTANTNFGSCKIEANANYQGNVLTNVTSRSAQDCCSQCQQTQGCNVFVFCGGDGGCDNGYGILVPSDLCTLKAQAGLVGTQQPAVWGRGPSVPFTSGLVSALSDLPVNPSQPISPSPAVKAINLVPLGPSTLDDIASPTDQLPLIPLIKPPSTSGGDNGSLAISPTPAAGIKGRISVSDLLSDAYYQQLSPSVVQNPDYIPEEYRIDCSIDADEFCSLRTYGFYADEGNACHTFFDCAAPIGINVCLSCPEGTAYNNGLNGAGYCDLTANVPCTSANQPLPSLPPVLGPVAASICPFQYNIQPGDTLCKLTSRYNVSTSELQLANPGLRASSELPIGTWISMPCPKPMHCCPVYYYAVHEAETFASIAHKLDTTEATLQAANPGSDGDRLLCGATLKVPCDRQPGQQDLACPSSFGPAPAPGPASARPIPSCLSPAASPEEESSEAEISDLDATPPSLGQQPPEESDPPSFAPYEAVPNPDRYSGPKGFTRLMTFPTYQEYEDLTTLVQETAIARRRAHSSGSNDSESECGPDTVVNSLYDWLEYVPGDGGIPLAGVGRMANVSIPGGIGNLSSQTSSQKLLTVVDQVHAWIGNSSNECTMLSAMTASPALQAIESRRLAQQGPFCNQVGGYSSKAISSSTLAYCCDATGQLPSESTATICQSRAYNDINAYMRTNDVLQPFDMINPTGTSNVGDGTRKTFKAPPPKSPAPASSRVGGRRMQQAEDLYGMPARDLGLQQGLIEEAYQKALAGDNASTLTYRNASRTLLQDEGGICDGSCSFTGLYDLLTEGQGSLQCCVVMFEFIELRVTLKAQIGYSIPVQDILIVVTGLSPDKIHAYCAPTDIVTKNGQDYLTLSDCQQATQYQGDVNQALSTLASIAPSDVTSELSSLSASIPTLQYFEPGDLSEAVNQGHISLEAQLCLAGGPFLDELTNVLHLDLCILTIFIDYVIVPSQLRFYAKLDLDLEIADFSGGVSGELQVLGSGANQVCGFVKDHFGAASDGPWCSFLQDPSCNWGSGDAELVFTIQLYALGLVNIFWSKPFVEHPAYPSPCVPHIPTLPGSPPIPVYPPVSITRVVILTQINYHQKDYDSEYTVVVSLKDASGNVDPVYGEVALFDVVDDKPWKKGSCCHDLDTSGLNAYGQITLTKPIPYALLSNLHLGVDVFLFTVGHNNMNYQLTLLVWYSDGTGPVVRYFDESQVKQNGQDGKRCYACDAYDSKHECLDENVKPRSWLPRSEVVDTLCLDTPNIQANPGAYDAVAAGGGQLPAVSAQVEKYKRSGS